MILIYPFLFAHNISQQFVYNQLINLTHLTGLYLNHFDYSGFQDIDYDLNQNLSKLHIIGRNINIHFLVAIVQALKEINSVYIYDNTLHDEEVNYISSLILYKATLTNLGIWTVIGNTKILGNLHNFLTLSKYLSPTEIFNLSKSIKRLYFGFAMSDFNSRFDNYENKFVFEDLLNLLQKNIAKCEITFWMEENDMLIANGVKYNNIIESLHSNDHLNQFI